MNKETIIKKRVTTTKRPSNETGKLETVEKRTTKVIKPEPKQKKETAQKKEKRKQPQDKDKQLIN